METPHSKAFMGAEWPRSVYGPHSKQMREGRGWSRVIGWQRDRWQAVKFSRCQRDKQGGGGIEEEAEDRIVGNGRSESLKLRVTVVGPHNSNGRRQGRQGGRGAADRVISPSASPNDVYPIITTASAASAVSHHPFAGRQKQQKSVPLRTQSRGWSCNWH